MEFAAKLAIFNESTFLCETLCFLYDLCVSSFLVTQRATDETQRTTENYLRPSA